jgi:hypothetical protein
VEIRAGKRRVSSMAAKSSSLARLKALAKEIPDEPKIRGLLRVIENRHLGSDYAVAIIGASLIERALQAAILSRLVPLGEDDRNRVFNFEQKGPLADMAARNRMGAALGLYGPDTFKDLEKIRAVRNLFAHAPTLLGFDNKEIAQACLNFNLLEFVFKHEGKTHHKEPPKTAYVPACLQICR